MYMMKSGEKTKKKWALMTWWMIMNIMPTTPKAMIRPLS